MEKLKDLLITSKTRIITSLTLFLVIALVVVIDNYFLTWLILGAIYIVGFYESSNLFGIDENKLYIVAPLLWIACALSPNPLLMVFVAFVLLVVFELGKKDVDFKLFAPLIYPTIPMVLMLMLYDTFGIYSLLWMILIVSFTDIGAYVVGKFVGKNKFSSISPNKTIEGVLGGIIIGTILGTAIGASIYPFFIALIASLATSAVSIWGDLFESYLKRKADLKDSGNILPGHGGVLDRLDGHLFGIVIMIMILEGLL